MRTLLIDNYDSFTYNIHHLLGEVNGVPPTVVRNDAEWSSISLEDYDNIVVGPGPGHPGRSRDFGISALAIQESGLPVLGVCLGHQGVAELLGGSVRCAPEPMHGRVSTVWHNGRDIFRGLPSPFAAARYHSLAVTTLPDELEGIAWAEDGVLMGLRHHTRPVWGVQFHPESVASECGRQLLENFRDLTIERRSAPEYLAARPTARRSKYRILSRRIDAAPDAEAAYAELCAGNRHSFWLDAGSQTDDDSRFSIIGDGSGPFAEYITYQVSTRTICIEKAGEVIARQNQGFFDYLDNELRNREISFDDSLPFAFQLGYVGYLGYELKVEVGGAAAHIAQTPDAALLFVDRAVVIDHREGTTYLVCLSLSSDDREAERWMDHITTKVCKLPRIGTSSKSPLTESTSTYSSSLTPRHDKQAYISKIKSCLEEIRLGESYEICLTNILQSDMIVHPLDTYRHLRRISPVPYGALLDLPGVAVLSASPERFLSVRPDRIVESKPIKGTRPRGSTRDEDVKLRAELQTSEKDRAENLMIVDLLRNDLSTVCEVGSVHVPKLFDVETYAPVHQLVSTVRGVLRNGVSAVDCVRAAFPGGSMTGAPKLRTMEIIDRLEEGPRGIYSGALGWFSLNGAVDLSIVIRTIVVTADGVSFGVGGAVVALSDPGEEFEETRVKARAMETAIAVSGKRDKSTVQAGQSLPAGAPNPSYDEDLSS
ncbi:aminodeoxychorismate synthase component I [Nocardia terpenica]|uniref:aminodeoxychorismate synthase n=1 Tax=Nocardia terpenica TaxID=455432 RepID=A0A6G9Z9E8_9NOCA|nr:aminodeoxychorismate synthase component I [Nocardia terpenica]QIS22158.1 aminodeoxychorismate synthase component I [Nocardia terpenica]